jgi:hypothetical protein
MRMKLLLVGTHDNTQGRRCVARPRLRRHRRMGLGSQVVIATALLLGVLFTGVASSGAAAPASSSATPNNQYQFSVEPYAAAGSQQRADFAYQLLPGHRILDQFVVANSSQTAESFLVYGEDATNNSQTGAFGFEERSKMHNTRVGRWLAVGTNLLNVPAGKEVVDTFQLSIPATAPPGDHVGAVIVEELKGPAQRQKPTSVNVVLRIGVPVYVRVVGKPHPGLTIESLKVFHQSPVIPYVGNSKVAVQFDLVNTGNDILDPTSATVSITGLLSGTLHTYTVHQKGATQSRANPLPLQMLPGAKLTLTEEWSGIPPFDPLTAHVSVTSTDPSTALHVSTTASTSFWYFPWILVLIVLVLIAGIIVLIRRRRRRAKAGGARPSLDGEPGNDGPPPSPSMSDRESLEGAGI